MQISPADEQVLSLFSSLEKQSLYQVVCAATPKRMALVMLMKKQQ